MPYNVIRNIYELFTYDNDFMIYYTLLLTIFNVTEMDSHASKVGKRDAFITIWFVTPSVIVAAVVMKGLQHFAIVSKSKILITKLTLSFSFYV